MFITMPLWVLEESWTNDALKVWGALDRFAHREAQLSITIEEMIDLARLGEVGVRRGCEDLAQIGAVQFEFGDDCGFLDWTAIDGFFMSYVKGSAP